MATRVNSYSKINLGLKIGPVRTDGFHALATIYQTLDLHDVVTVSARRAIHSSISLTTNHQFVPVDSRNTAWKMVEGCLERLGLAAEVAIHIEKNLPVQGGLGAGSANAAAALLALERELGVALDEPARLELAAGVGSDVPLFLVGGAVLGGGRGERVRAMPDFAAMACVVAVPEAGVSTPAAFRAWDELVSRRGSGETTESDLRERGFVTGDAAGDGLTPATLTSLTKGGTLRELSLTHPSRSANAEFVGERFESGTSGILRSDLLPEKQQGNSDEQSVVWNDLAENTLLALVRTGIGSDLQNDFEEVVFPQYPSLRETKRQLMGSDSGSPAMYAALSGSGSALFGLYRSLTDARAAQHRVQASGVQAMLTVTLPRSDYWRKMFAG